MVTVKCAPVLAGSLRGGCWVRRNTYNWNDLLLDGGVQGNQTEVENEVELVTRR